MSFKQSLTCGMKRSGCGGDFSKIHKGPPVCRVKAWTSAFWDDSSFKWSAGDFFLDKRLSVELKLTSVFFEFATIRL